MAGDNCFEAEGLGFLILIVCIWIVGLLGIILSSISINNIRKIKEKPGMKKPNPWFSGVMLTIFLLIFIGATIYVSLYIATSKNKDEFMKENLKVTENTADEVYDQPEQEQEQIRKDLRSRTDTQDLR